MKGSRLTTIEALMAVAVVAILVAIVRSCGGLNDKMEYDPALGGWIVTRPDGTKFVRDGRGNVRQIVQEDRGR